MPIRIIVLTQELCVLHALWSSAESNAWQVESAEHAWEIPNRMRSPHSCDLLIVDTAHFRTEALDLLRTVCRVPMTVPVLVICRPEDAQCTSEAIRLGAQVIARPFAADELEIECHRAIRSNGKVGSTTKPELERLRNDEFFLGTSSLMQQVRAQAESLVAHADVATRMQPMGHRKHSLKALLQEIKSQAERHAIAAALQKTRWNRKQAARLLSVSYRTLLYKIERYRVEDSPQPLQSAGSSTTETDIERARYREKGLNWKVFEIQDGVK